MFKIKQKIWYLVGSFVAFAFSALGMSPQAQMEYGISPDPGFGVNSSWWEKMILPFLAPIIIIVAILLIIVFGVVYFFKKRTNQDVKKDS